MGFFKKTYNLTNVRRLLLSAIAVPSTILSYTQAQAAPSGAEVVHGDIEIGGEVNGKTTIIQKSRKGIIDWDTFSVGKGEQLHFDQKHGAAASTLNRVTGTDPSLIHGKITAPGEVIVVNQNGVIFGKDAQVDVGALVVSTADIDNSDYLAGDYRFDQAAPPDSQIVNEGTITIRDAGVAAFVAPSAINDGVIVAKQGRVLIAGTQTATLDLYGDGLVEIAMTDEAAMPLAMNTGTISAQGGSIVITAAEAKGVVDSVVMNRGVVHANRVTQSDDGTITLHATGGTSIQAGTLDASAAIETVRGGHVEILGDTVILAEGSITAASGGGGTIDNSARDTANMTADGRVKTQAAFLEDDRRSGGSIKIGGDYLGTGDTPTANTTIVESGALILNDAYDTGDGGRTIIWANDTTRFAGTIFARGGLNGGNGGFVETSGKHNLAANGFVDLSASQLYSRKGTYLLDPDNITIFGNIDPKFISTDGSINLNNNLTLWLDASDTTTIDDTGGFVNTWHDKSDNNNDVTASGTERPLTRSATQNGLNLITFDGSNDRLTGTANVAGSQASVFILYQRTVSTGRDAVLELGSGGSRNGIFLFANQSTQAYTNGDFKAQATPHSIGGFTSTSLIYNGTSLQGATNGSPDLNAVTPNRKSTSAVTIGDDVTSGDEMTGDVAELFVYDTSVTTETRQLLEQYQSAKWDLDLAPPGSGADELSRATASDGYNVFTTRYLERLAQTADIALVANNDITLDLQGDTLNLTGALSDRSISLTATTGNITSVSSATIETLRTINGGNITMNAGGAIALDGVDLIAGGGGAITLNAGSSLDITNASSINLDHNDTFTAGAGDIVLESLASVSLNNATLSATGAINIDASTTLSWLEDSPLQIDGHFVAGTDMTLSGQTDISLSATTMLTAGNTLTLVSSRDEGDTHGRMTLPAGANLSATTLQLYGYSPALLTLDASYNAQSLSAIPLVYNTAYPAGVGEAIFIETGMPVLGTSLPKSLACLQSSLSQTKAMGTIPMKSSPASGINPLSNDNDGSLKFVLHDEHNAHSVYTNYSELIIEVHPAYRYLLTYF